jgi:hypothetical protein
MNTNITSTNRSQAKKTIKTTSDSSKTHKNNGSLGSRVSFATFGRKLAPPQSSKTSKTSEKLLLRRIASEFINRQKRLKEAEEISDSLEFSVNDYDEIDYQNILQEIIDTAIQEKDAEIREVLLNAVADALSHRDCVQELDLSSLSQIINALNLDCLLHGLDIIGLSRNEKYIDLIKTFLKHPISEVRETAEIALEELGVK